MIDGEPTVDKNGIYYLSGFALQAHPHDTNNKE